MPSDADDRFDFSQRAKLGRDRTQNVCRAPLGSNGRFFHRDLHYIKLDAKAESMESRIAEWLKSQNRHISKRKEVAFNTGSSNF
ncbi:hypothetical protein [Bremerella cremea]|uniref:hypothetical protein n=1 Tax=Bremerella cremea TaxID=1031537 RepID=UPI0031EF77BA